MTGRDTMTKQLAPELTNQLQKFARDFHESGFGIIRHAIEPAYAAALHDRLQNLLEPLPAGAEAPRQRFVPRIVEHDSGFAEMATRAPLVKTLASLLGVVPHLICSYGHEKPARTDSHTGIHSDVAHLPGVPHHLSFLMIKAMYALTPVRAGGGETVVFPGSHRRPADTEQADLGAGHHIVMDPGDLLLFHANIRHTATSNSSQKARLSVWFIYALPWMRVFPGFEYGAEFLAGVGPRLGTEPHLKSVFGLDDPYATVV